MPAEQLAPAVEIISGHEMPDNQRGPEANGSVVRARAWLLGHFDRQEETR